MEVTERLQGLGFSLLESFSGRADLEELLWEGLPRRLALHQSRATRPFGCCSGEASLGELLWSQLDIMAVADRASAVNWSRDWFVFGAAS